MGPDYGHPLRMIYHLVLITLALGAGLLLTIWCWPKMIPELQRGNRAHWSGFLWSFALIAEGLIVYGIW